MDKKKSKAARPFDAGVYLESAGVKRKIVPYRKRQVIFSQGDKCSSVLYLQTGVVKITVNSSAGKEAVIALLEPGDFFGEGCISGQPLRVSTATAMGPVSGPGDREAGNDPGDSMRSTNSQTGLLLTYAETQRARRRGFGRSAVQFERETPGPRTVADRPVRKQRKATENRGQGFPRRPWRKSWAPPAAG